MREVIYEREEVELDNIDFPSNISMFGLVEIALLINTNIGLKELIKLIFLDLLYNQVLVIKKKQAKRHPNHNYIREFFIVETGQNFITHNFKNYENHFHENIDTEHYYYLIPYLKSVYKSFSSENKLKREIIENNNLFADFFSKNRFFDFFGIVKTNNKGKKVRDKLKEYLIFLDNLITNEVEKIDDEIVGHIIELKEIIFLLDNFKLLENLKNIFKERKHVTEVQSDYLFYDELLPTGLNLEIFEEAFNRFDSSDFDFSSSYDVDSDYDF